MATSRRRTYDSEALASIVRTVEERGTLNLNFPTRNSAIRVRAEFYSWRKQEQILQATFACDIQARCEGTTVVFSRSADPILRSALGQAGVVLPLPLEQTTQDLPQLPLPPVESQPPSRMEQTIAAAYGTKEDPSGPDKI